MIVSTDQSKLLYTCSIRLLCLTLLVFAPKFISIAEEPSFDAWLEASVSRIEQNTNREFESITPENWEKTKSQWRSELMEMLGLPSKILPTELLVKVTSTIEHDDVVIENLHYQSAPGLYVTANLYRPNADPPKEGWPSVLYVCGHAQMKEHGKLLGNKTGYHHHGLWFARHGVVCLTIDTIQLGELHGEHHGTYKLGRWDWITKGYTPAGVEALNAVRGIDVLQSLEYVNDDKLGITGRSGGGAYSWFAAAIDDRIKVAVPVAGITDLRNHVVDRCVNGHCDCMYFVNQYHWDYGKLAALVAPRPLLLANSDNDSIFPLDGVMRIHQQVKDHYERLNASQNFGLIITPGPHQDTQELQVGAFKWLLKNLNGEVPVIEKAATKDLDPKSLAVFPNQIPNNERVTSLPGWFTDQLNSIENHSSDYESYQKSLDAWLTQTQMSTDEITEFDSLVSLSSLNFTDERGSEYEVQYLKHSSLSWRLVRIARQGAQGTILHCDAIPLETSVAPESISKNPTVVGWLNQVPNYHHYFLLSPFETWKGQAYAAGKKTEFARQLYLLGTSVEKLQLEELQQSQLFIEAVTKQPIHLATSNRNAALAMLLANSGSPTLKSKRTIFLDRFTAELPLDLILPGLNRWTSFQELLQWTKQKCDLVEVTTQSVTPSSINEVTDRPFASTGYQVALTSTDSASVTIRTTKWPLPNLGDLQRVAVNDPVSSTPVATDSSAQRVGYASPGVQSEVRMQYRCNNEDWKTTDWIATNAENGFQATFSLNDLQASSSYSLRFQGRIEADANEYNLASGSFQSLPKTLTSKPFKLAVFPQRPRFIDRDGGYGYRNHITLLNRNTTAVLYAKDDFETGSSITLNAQQYLGLPTTLALNQSVASLLNPSRKDSAQFDSYKFGESLLLVRLSEESLRDSKSREELLKLASDSEHKTVVLISTRNASPADSSTPAMTAIIESIRKSGEDRNQSILSIEAVIKEPKDSGTAMQSFNVVSLSAGADAIQALPGIAEQSQGYLELSLHESQGRVASLVLIDREGNEVLQYDLK